MTISNKNKALRAASAIADELALEALLQLCCAPHVLIPVTLTMLGVHLWRIYRE